MSTGGMTELMHQSPAHRRRAANDAEHLAALSAAAVAGFSDNSVAQWSCSREGWAGLRSLSFQNSLHCSFGQLFPPPTDHSDSLVP